jgi:hypothetical protein
MPDIGYTSAGASATDAQGVIVGTEGTTDGTGGAVTSITAHARYTVDPEPVTACVYRKSDDVKMGSDSGTSTAWTTSASWQTITYTGPTLAASTAYVPSICATEGEAGQFHISYDSTGAEGHDHYIGDTRPLPDPAGWFNEDTGTKYSIYATYGGGGAASTPKGPLGNPFFGPFGGPI